MLGNQGVRCEGVAVIGPTTLTALVGGPCFGALANQAVLVMDVGSLAMILPRTTTPEARSPTRNNTVTEQSDPHAEIATENGVLRVGP